MLEAIRGFTHAEQSYFRGHPGRFHFFHPLGLPGVGFHGVVVIAGLIGAHEYARMARPDSESWERWSFVVICTAVIVWPLILPVWQGYTHGVALSMGFFAMALLRLARHSRSRRDESFEPRPCRPDLSPERPFHSSYFFEIDLTVSGSFSSP